jgi:hypothetical protein
MTDITIRLPAYSNVSVNLPRQTILDYFPQSLLAQALSEDPNAEEIILENPIITPEDLHILADYLQGQEPKHSNPHFAEVDRYLNIPQLQVYADPLYDEISQPIDTLWPIDDWEEYTEEDLKRLNWTVLLKAIDENHPLILSYLRDKGFDLGMAYFYAFQYHHEREKDVLLRLMIPTYEINKLIIEAVLNDNVMLFNSLPQTRETLEVAAIVAAAEHRTDVLQGVLKATSYLSPTARHLISVLLSAYEQNYKGDEKITTEYFNWLVRNRFL